MTQTTIAILTAGGIAPCLSSAVAGLIERYFETLPNPRILCYRSGYKGLLLGDFIEVTKEHLPQVSFLHEFGGSPIGNSRVKFTNVKDCLKKGLVKEGQNPLDVAVSQLLKEGVDILHTIGGDDTNTAAADLATHIQQLGKKLVVVGLPKTIDNDVYPIVHTLGASTAAEAGAKFFENVVHEHTANPKMLIVHEVMGRHCGWLAAETARIYTERLAQKHWAPNFGFNRERFEVHALYLPEKTIDFRAEAQRLRQVMDTVGNVNIFLSEGACADAIVGQLEAEGKTVPRDAFGHAKLDAIHTGEWIGRQLMEPTGAEKLLVQKSGYYARSAPANAFDLHLIKSCVDKAVEGALLGQSGVVGHDEDQGNLLRLIEFHRIKGGKPYRG
jgi:pyrophosphate--fructose-6-phosphate 1-phosphotransferase